jgi:hypothetical protein
LVRLTSAITCSPNCLDCFPGGLNSCNQCAGNFYITSGQCFICNTMIGCTFCDGKQCLSCSNGLFLSPFNRCLICSTRVPYCSTCDSVSGTPFCSTCQQGYTINSSLPNNGCQACNATLKYCSAC